MITYNDALKKLLADYPNSKPTGHAYSYDGDYFIELVDKETKIPAVVLDGYFKVNGKTGESSAATVLDLPVDYSKVTRLDKRN